MKTTNNYSVDFFINYYKSKPDHLWAVGEQDTYDGKHCALGWPNYHDKNYNMAESLRVLFEGVRVKVLKITSRNGNIIGQTITAENSVIAAINNGEAAEYQQDTPKARILAALEDIKKLQHPAPKAPEVVERVVYVAFDASVRELQKQLNEN